MKHTSFAIELTDIYVKAAIELRKALEAHGGRYDYTQLETVPKLDGEKVCQARIFDGRIFVETENSLLKAEELSVEDIATLIDYIPETDEVKDVSGVYPVPFLWLYTDDLKHRGFVTDDMTQEKLDAIASEMSGLIVDWYFYDIMEDVAKEQGIKQTKED